MRMGIEPTPWAPDQRRQYLIGLALGAVPLLVWLVFIGWAGAEMANQGSNQYAGLGPLLSGLLIFIVLWFVHLIATIVQLARQRQRFVGYGLLTMLLIGPIAGSIACFTLPNLV